MEGSGRNETRTARAVPVKNRAPAQIQITAEQIMVEARDRAQLQQAPPPKRHITDIAELKEHQLRVRKEFEDRLRLSRANLAVWMRYSKWEEGQNELERARSIYERALDIDYKHVPLWIRYAEMEMRHKFINRARNVWDRAVQLLPRVEVLWYKYTYMEEVLGNTAGARLVFERWMTWEPEEQAWLSYAKLEIRCGEKDRARAVYERYLACHPGQAAYIRYAKWEEKANGQRALARRLYERAASELRDDEKDETLYDAFASFEERCGEIDRARVVFKYGLQSLAPAGVEAGAAAAAAVAAAGLQGANTPAGRKAAAYSRLYEAYTRFEKARGEKSAVEGVILDKRRAQYEEAVAVNALNYDAWLDFTRLEEVEGADGAYATALADLQSGRRVAPDGALGKEEGGAAQATAVGGLTAALRAVSSLSGTMAAGSADPIGSHPAVLAQAARIRAVYDRATAAAPPVAEKRFWRRYVFLWLNYAAWEELLCPQGCRDVARTRGVYRSALDAVPHARFTFAKLWLAAAKYEVRQGDIPAARRLLGTAMGIAFKPRLVKGYIEIEDSLGEIERCRKLYESWLSRQPAAVAAWCSFVDLERSVGENERARAILEMAIQQAALDAPEAAWKHYIDMEIGAGDAARARGLYERLLERTQHVKVWLSFAAFELSVCGSESRARGVFERGYTALKKEGGKNSTDGDGAVRAQRALLAETWLEWESARLVEAQDRLETVHGPAGGDGERSGRVARDEAEIDLDDDAGADAGKDEAMVDGTPVLPPVVDPTLVAIDPTLVAIAQDCVREARARVDRLEGMQPRRVRRRRAVFEDGTRGAPAPIGVAVPEVSGAPLVSASGAALSGYEEFSEWLFPDDEMQAPALKLLQMAAAWKAAGGKLSASSMNLSTASGAGGAGRAAQEPSALAGMFAGGSAGEDLDIEDVGSGDLGGVLSTGHGRPDRVPSGAVRGLLASAMSAALALSREDDGDGEADVRAGRKRARDEVGDSMDDSPAHASGPNASVSVGADEALPLPGALASHVRHMPQSVFAEGVGEGDADTAHGLSTEREMEHEVRDRGQGDAGTERGAPMVVDMHAEADAGWVADRD